MKKNIIIIGAGVSGLSAGIFAQKKGFNTIILEKNHFAGGNLTGWKRKNCYIDNCIHWLCGSKDGNKLNKLWKEVGAFENIEFYQSEDFLVSEYNFQKISLNKNIDITHQNMLNLSAADKKEIDKFIKGTKLITKLNYSNIFNKIKILFKLYSMYKNKTIKQVADSFSHPLLKKFITDYIVEEYSIYTLLSAYSSFSSGDGKVLKNGSFKMAENITKKYTSLGGEIKYNSHVIKIITENTRAVGVKLKNGEIIKADFVICAIDPSIVFSSLLDTSYMTKNLKMTYGDRENFPIISSFHVAYKITTDLNIPDTFVFESSKPIRIGATDYNRIMIRSYKYGINFTNDNSFVMQVFLLQREVDYDKWSSLSNQDYEKEKQRITEEITNEILKRFKKLKNNIEFLDCWTPLTYTKYFDAYKGSYMSFGVTKKLKLSIFPYKCENIDNLYFATQWQRIFGGLPNAVMCGKNCIEELTKKTR